MPVPEGRLARLRASVLHGAAGPLDRLRARFPPAGLLAWAVLLMTAALGLDTERSMAYQLFTFTAAALVLAAVAARAGRPTASASWRLPRHGTAGEPLPCVLTLTAGGRGLRGVEASALRGRWPAPSREWVPVPDCAARGSVEVPLRFVSERRGRLRVSGALLARPDPLGLVRALRVEPAEASTLILPRRYPAPLLALPGSRRYQQGGVASSSSVGESQEFMAMRDYRPGDPLRKIHWKSWAKTGRPIVKEYQDEYFVRHALALDTAGLAGPVFEEAVSVAASFAATVPAGDTMLDLLFVGAGAYCYSAGRGLGAADRLLEVLACVEPAPAGSFATLASSVLLRAPAMSGCICVLLGLDEARRDFLRRLRAAGVPTLALVVREPGGPPLGETEGARVLEVGRAAEGLAGLAPGGTGWGLAR